MLWLSFRVRRTLQVCYFNVVSTSWVFPTAVAKTCGILVCFSSRWNGQLHISITFSQAPTTCRHICMFPLLGFGITLADCRRLVNCSDLVSSKHLERTKPSAFWKIFRVWGPHGILSNSVRTQDRHVGPEKATKNQTPMMFGDVERIQNT